MKKVKYLALLAVVALSLSVFTTTGLNVGGNMPDWDGNKHPVYQTNYPPVIDGIVEVGVTWPAESFIDHTYIAGGNDVGDIPTTDVYILFDNLDGYASPPTGYGPEDEQGYYLYIGIKALDGYQIHTDGHWLVIDWDQDGVIDFADNNGNSAGSGANQGYSTQYARTDEGVEWAIPYLDDFSDGICMSPFYILVHIEIYIPCTTYETTTFPGRGGSGPFESTELCPWEEIEPEPPEPGDWGLRTIGFWKHQLRCALGISNGHQHVPTDQLTDYISYISATSQIPELQDMGGDMTAALALLELHGKHPMYDRAVQQLLGTWLNYVSGNEMWDSDGDDVDDTDILDTILWAEDILLNGDPADHEIVKDTLDALNNSGDE
jgi:hypothetical protein